ncbi:MAG: hypothetical protein PWQ91_1831, partial [Eubacteriales bacterium]|nr:hypothetical protein [Eubacteriales bacterium]
KFFLIQFYNKNVPFCMFFSQKKTADRYFVDSLSSCHVQEVFFFVEKIYSSGFQLGPPSSQEKVITLV